VLVVSATTLDGKALIDDEGDVPGSNWNRRMVHVAAPGIGFYAPGRDNSYVPLHGTSFAAPLVTATAALLYRQGIADPWLIKQRIIATVDRKGALVEKVFSGGLLNVARAVTAPTKAVLRSSGTLVVDVEPQPIEVRWDTGSRTLPLANVRRLTRMDTGDYRIVYLDEVTDSLVIQEGVQPGPWPFHYWQEDADGTRIRASGQIESFRDYVGPIR
jgi:hypothetical protein